MTLLDRLADDAGSTTLGLGDDAGEALARRWAEGHPDGGTRREAMLQQLTALRDGEDAAGPHVLDLRGLNLVDADLSGLDLTGSDLSRADLSRADLSGATLMGTKLVGTMLFDTNLTRTELAGADLRGANLERVSAEGAGLGHARLDGATLTQANLRGATLTEATLRGADLRLARMTEVRARSADFTEADLSRAELRDADLTDVDVAGATLRSADLRGANVSGIRGYAKADWVRVDLRDVDFNHAHLCRRFVLDQNYIEEFKNQSRAARLVYYAWWITSDCGRSLLRWGVLTATLALFFSVLYTMVDVDYGTGQTALSPLYYSVVTLTTLGYGDVVPASQAAQVVCMVEVILGYVMLGGLLSIFSNKMARRAD